MTIQSGFTLIAFSSARISKKRQSKPAAGSGPIEKYLVASTSSKRKQSWLTPPSEVAIHLMLLTYHFGM